MKNKKRIFAIIAVLVVCFMYIANITAFASYRLYEMDARYNEKDKKIEFTSVKNATYYEIRAFVQGDTMSNDTGALLVTYTPSKVSTGEELYSVTEEQLDASALALVKLKPYYILKVYAYNVSTAPEYCSITVNAKYCDADNNGGKIARGGSYSVTFTDSTNPSYSEYSVSNDNATLTVFMGGVNITNSDNVTVDYSTYGQVSVNVTNITGALVISMTAAMPAPPSTLDTPHAWIDGEFLRWDSVPQATEYYVEVYKGDPGSVGTLIYGDFTANTSFDVASEYDGDEFYYVRVKACYSTTIVQSASTSWFTFDFSQISTNPPTNAPMMDIDYSSVDTCIGESNPITFFGSGAGTCKLKHYTDENGDGFDDVSYNNGIAEGIVRAKNSNDANLTDLLPSILGAVAGFFVSVTGNMSVGGVTILSIFSIVAFVFIVFLIIKVIK